MARCVVKLETTMWHDKRAIHHKRSISFLKRKCKGHNVIKEDCEVSGAWDILSRINNLMCSNDGVYEIIVCNEENEYWDYMLIPYVEN